MPMELMPADIRSKYQAKPSDRSKRAKKEENKTPANHSEDNNEVVNIHIFLIFIILFL